MKVCNYEVLWIFYLRFSRQNNFQLSHLHFSVVNKSCHHQITSYIYIDELEAYITFVKTMAGFLLQATAFTSLGILKRGKRAMLINQNQMIYKYHYSKYLKLMTCTSVLNGSKALERSNTQYDIRLQFWANTLN